MALFFYILIQAFYKILLKNEKFDKSCYLLADFRDVTYERVNKRLKFCYLLVGFCDAIYEMTNKGGDKDNEIFKEDNGNNTCLCISPA